MAVVLARESYFCYGKCGAAEVLALRAVWAVYRKRPVAGTLPGLAVHLGVYLVAYAPTTLIWRFECRDEEMRRVVNRDRAKS